MVDVTKAKNFLLTTDFPLDKVIYQLQGSFSLNASFASNSATIAHKLPFIPLPLMSWSIHSDFSVCYESGTGSPTSNVLTNNYGIEADVYADSTNINISATNFTEGAVTFYYRVYGFEPSDSNADVPFTSIAGDDFVLNTDFNYTKLYLEGKLTLASSTVVTHNLGYIPQIQAWTQDGTGIYPAQVNNSLLDTTSGGAGGNAGFIVTTTTLTFTGFTFSTYGHYRIYLDS